MTGGGRHKRTSRPAASGTVRATRPWSWPPANGLAAALYLLASLALWWHLWAAPGTKSTCGCGDNALTLWVIEWPAYALAHGQNLFYTSALFHPHGINMVPNSLALGVALAPVSWAFGPVASSNVITVLSPALSALAMFWLLRRWVSWAPGAFVGGLAWGYSPFALTSLALGHPNFGLQVLPPLIVGCLDELVVRHRRGPVAVGVLLGLAVVVEFFVSVEELLLLICFGLVGLAAAAFYGALGRPGDLAGRARRVLGGLGVATLVTVVLLAYPAWYYFRGPAHLKGRAWPNSPPGVVGGSPSDLVHGFISPVLTATMHAFGGYQGPALPTLVFLGPGLLAVAVIGMVLLRRRPAVWLWGGLGVVAVALSMGVHTKVWTPWRLFTHVPVIDNVVPANIAAITAFCVAVLVGLTVSYARSLPPQAARRSLGVALAGATALVALVPVVAAYWPNIPMTARTVSAPRWFSTAGATSTTPRAVILPYPPALGGIQSSMAWQALGRLSFDMVGGGGPGIVPSRQGTERPGFDVLARAAIPLGPAPLPSPANLAAIDGALGGWDVTKVVVPAQPELPSYDRGRSVSYAVALFTAALGRAPRFTQRAFVWTLPGREHPAVPLSAQAFGHCVAEPPAAASACVLAGAP